MHTHCSLVPSPTPSFSSLAVRYIPLYRTASDEKLGVGLGTRLHTLYHDEVELLVYLHQRGRKVVKSGGAKNPGGEASVHVP